MGFLKELAKKVVHSTLSPRMQHRVRRFHLSRQVVARSGFREPEIDVLASVVGENDAVADIGANVGAYTREFASLVGRRGVVYSFEPVAANCDILQTVVQRGRFANVQTFQMALSSESGERDISIPAMDGFTGYYWAHFAQLGDTGPIERVQVTTLDELRKQGRVPHLDFAKCDVEGSELQVLLGARHVIETDHPGWLIEVSRSTSFDVFALLTSAGYWGFVYDGEVKRTREYLDKQFSNYFFLHPGSLSWGRLRSSKFGAALV